MLVVVAVLALVAELVVVELLEVLEMKLLSCRGPNTVVVNNTR